MFSFSFSFLSTPSARRATKNLGICQEKKAISIHALREEGDIPAARVVLDGLDFYPRPPRGGRLRMLLNSALISLFLSTPSARRATDGYLFSDQYGTEFLSTPSARRATVASRLFESQQKFLSTPSARRATHRRRDNQFSEDISIHALREEGDPSTSCDRHSKSNFYPRPPRGGRP